MGVSAGAESARSEGDVVQPLVGVGTNPTYRATREPNGHKALGCTCSREEMGMCAGAESTRNEGDVVWPGTFVGSGPFLGAQKEEEKPMPKNAHIIMIRHAEKPDDGKDPKLSARGEMRARAYVVYFQNLHVTGEAVKLNHLIAAANSPQSRRAHQTLEPLAKEIGLTIHDKHRETDYEALAKVLLEHPKYNDSQILICWHHGEILQLAHALGAPADALPPRWPEDIYGWLLQLHFDADGTLTVEPVRNQQLMYDDHGKDPD